MVPNDKTEHRLSVTETRVDGIADDIAEIKTDIREIHRKLNAFILAHDAKCPGRFSIVGAVGFLAALVALAKLFLFNNKAG